MSSLPHGSVSSNEYQPRPRTASFIATTDGLVFHHEDTDTSSDYPSSDSDDVPNIPDQDMDSTSEQFSHINVVAEEAEGNSNVVQNLTKLKDLIQQLGTLPPILDDPQRHRILGTSCLQRATSLLQEIKQAFEEASRPPNLHCDVCMEDLPREHFPSHDVTERCDHDHSICLDCLSQSIAAQLDDKGWDQITCPTSSCGAKLSSLDVETYADPFAVARYHRFMLAFALSSDPNFRHCLREGCQFGQVHESGTNEPVMYCGECYYKMCFVHKRPWHEGQTCAQYDENLRSKERHQREESQSEVMIAQTTKTCPGEGCAARIEKRDGCDHMTCKRCRHEFCWQCLAPYRPIKTFGNAGHKAECPYSNAALPPNALLNPTRYLQRPGVVQAQALWQEWRL